MSGSGPQFKAPPAQPKPPGLATGSVGYSASHGVEYGRYIPGGTPFGYSHPQMPPFMPPGVNPPPPFLRPPQRGHPSVPPNHGVSSRPKQVGRERPNDMDSLNLPRQFVPNEQCFDSRPVSFLPNQEGKNTLLRHVKASAWSSKHGIANQAIEQVPLVKSAIPRMGGRCTPHSFSR